MQRAIEDLALRLMGTGEFEDFEAVFDHLPRGKEDNHIFRYVLAMYHNMECCGCNPADLLVVGGYSVLPWVVKHTSEGQIREWRGSHDADVVIRSRDLEGAVLRNYLVTGNSRSLSVPNKKVVILEENGETCEVDLYIPPRNSEPFRLASFVVDDIVWTNAQRIEVFGIGVYVPSVIDILRMKTNIKSGETGLPREKDINDIITMLGVAEREGISIPQLRAELTDPQYAAIRNSLAAYPVGSRLFKSCVIKLSDVYLRRMSEE